MKKKVTPTEYHNEMDKIISENKDKEVQEILNEMLEYASTVEVKNENI